MSWTDLIPEISVDVMDGFDTGDFGSFWDFGDYYPADYLELSAAEVFEQVKESERKTEAYRVKYKCYPFARGLWHLEDECCWLNKSLMS